MFINDDRWTCPERGCNRTFVFHLRGESLEVERIATQIRHAQHHQAAKREVRAELLARFQVA